MGERLAIAGLGTIGAEVARRLHGGAVPGVELVAVAGRDRDATEDRLRRLAPGVPFAPVDSLEPLADVVVECAHPAALPAIAEPFLRAGKEVIVLSAGALLDHWHLVELAAASGGRITVPTGALVGLDAVGAAAENGIHSVRLTTRKPFAALAGAPGLELAAPTEAVKVFSGSARAAVKAFPTNMNIAVALALAGIGPDRTEVELWADPTLTRNTHTVVVRSDITDLTMTIENSPSENPRTGRIAALSVISLLRKRHCSLSVGT
jgi:aspartate dehydrogenase